MIALSPELINQWKQQNILMYRRWPWHLLFWTGYVLFRLWPYYLTLRYYNHVFLEYMLLSEILFVAITYFTVWLYRSLFELKKYSIYFFTGTISWIFYLYVRTVFQMYYLKSEPGFNGNGLTNIILGNITFVVVYFLFITACKYFKDGYIAQQYDAERKKQQLVAEVNNLKSQIAPHFLFNTLNNLYGLAVDKSDKLPGLMLQLSDLLRHSLYETQKPRICINDEMNVLKSYMELERVRLEDDLKLEFNNGVSPNAKNLIAPLILIVFVENAFKHARLVQSGSVQITITTVLENNCFCLTVVNNYNMDNTSSATGIGLTNVKRRLEVLYPGLKHQLAIIRDEEFYKIILQLQLDEPFT